MGNCGVAEPLDDDSIIRASLPVTKIDFHPVFAICVSVSECMKHDSFPTSADDSPLSTEKRFSLYKKSVTRYLMGLYIEAIDSFVCSPI